MSAAPATVLVSTGDASGDARAAALVRALRAREPRLRFLGAGGTELEKAGVELVVDQREFDVGGFLAVLGSAGRLLAALRRLGRALDQARPDLVVLVDYGGFNVRFARRARRAGAPVLYYVIPQVWAWRRYRMRHLARRVDRLAGIFPFEPAVWAGTGVRVDFVGHPLAGELARVRAHCDRAGARAALGLDPDARLVALLPGSRRYELRHMLPVQLATARLLHARDPGMHFALALAPSADRAQVEGAVRAAGLPDGLRLDLFAGHTYDVARAADVAVAKPGTIALELALLDCPFVVIARANPVEVAVARRMIRVPWLSMPNLIAGEPVVPELVQGEARPERVAPLVEELLAGPAREAQLRGLAAVRRRLGRGDAAERTAEIAREMLHGPARP